ncbi:response regulator [Paenibacillus alkaliterrae]|uniref:response regulator transcription factor n=1 Tax=Paenibacillus alkaliterrae TaxID=320909 RepID=UPI001F28C1F5|nr:response regulator [Paenibacillus alkaliterrae]MCF2937712.1 response regulator [Paenibacillus alkaliterrae]
MMNVLVVDDDKLVRKGLISAMPWQDFNLQVVGEARNGEKALEVLASQDVDLLLTDLAMPVMSGLELMRIVRKKYPHIFIVVLTLHQDFEYIQEALRLGAIDYIAKVQLEEENFEEVLGRICGRIADEQAKLDAQEKERGKEEIRLDQGYAMITLMNSSVSEHIEPSIMSNLSPSREIVPGLRLWLPADDREARETGKQLSQAAVEHSQLCILQLNGMEGQDLSQVERLLIAYKIHGLFYSYRPNTNIYPLLLNSMKATPPEVEQSAMMSVRERGLSLEWVHKASLFEQLVEDLYKLQLPVVQLMNELGRWVLEWNRIYQPVTSCSIDAPASPDCWVTVEEWLNKTRNALTEALGKPLYSADVQECILKSVQLIHAGLAGRLNVTGICQEVNMSRSYFSQCFRDIVGSTFNDYVRQLRVNKAKEYLLKTNKTIFWIAEHTGYADEKYFSRIFRKHTGLLPSEFRQLHRAGGETSET